MRRDQTAHPAEPVVAERDRHGARLDSRQLGVAIAIDDGLVTPVIKEAEKKTLLQAILPDKILHLLLILSAVADHHQRGSYFIPQ